MVVLGTFPGSLLFSDAFFIHFQYHLYVNQNPELAGELTRKEAGFIAEILTLAGLEAGKVRSLDSIKAMEHTSILH